MDSRVCGNDSCAICVISAYAGMTVTLCVIPAYAGIHFESMTRLIYESPLALVKGAGYVSGFLLAQKSYEHANKPIDGAGRRSLHVGEGRKGMKGSIKQGITINQNKLPVFFYHLGILEGLAVFSMNYEL